MKIKSVLVTATLYGVFCMSASTEDVKIGFGTQLPPYVIRQSDSMYESQLSPYPVPQEDTGMELEIIKAALKSKAYNLVPVYMTLANVEEDITKNQISGFCPCNESLKIKDEELKFSNSHITYHNMAITSKKSKFKINRIADLAGKKVYAFQNAKIYLGDEFRKMAESNPNYQEIPLRGKHIAIASNEADSVIIMDKNIFSYYITRYSRLGLKSLEDFNYHNIFPKSKYKVGFFDEKIRNDFNEGLELIKNNGEYDRIVDSFTKLINKRIEEAEDISKKNKSLF